MKGKLQALSIQTYILLDKKEEVITQFDLKSEKQRKKIDPLQGTIISVKEIEKILS